MNELKTFLNKYIPLTDTDTLEEAFNVIKKLKKKRIFVTTK